MSSEQSNLVNIELTSKCNLRCVYCAVSNKGYVGSTMAPEEVEKTIQTLIQKGVKSVQLNGHGESTTVKDWWKYCHPLLEAGVEIILTTNAALKFDEPSLDVMCRFKSIIFSIDSADPELFAKIRRGGSLERLLENMSAIANRAKQKGIRAPEYSWSCVLSDKNIFGIPALVKLGLQYGVRAFGFCNLKKYERPKEEFQVHHVSTMPLEQIKLAYKIMKYVEAWLISKGVVCDIQAGFFPSLEEVMSKNQSASEEKTGTFYEVPKEKMTRACMDPWSFSYIQASGDVLPCCWHDPIGNINEQKYEVILQSEKAKALQNSILTGNLDSQCAQCPTRKMISIHEFGRKFKTQDLST